MFLITDKVSLTKTVSMLKIKARDVVRHAKPGQFVMLRVEENGERIPLTIAEANQTDDTISVIFQIVGATTMKLNQLNKGDYLIDFAGPMGKPAKLDGLKKVCVIGGGVGCAIAYPIAKALKEKNTIVHTIIGFRTKDLVFLENEFNQISEKSFLVTDDGSYRNQGRVTDILKDLLEKGESYDEVYAIGPLLMMKFVSELTKEYQTKTIVSMNPVMVDGTGMCGGCRVSVGNEMKFACVDGPEFDGHQVNFDEAIIRNKMYESFESKKYKEVCNHPKEESK
jgi:ferredoxin/flavodoxin---NADP+ reductase